MRKKSLLKIDVVIMLFYNAQDGIPLK